jgi:hypothetical protein
MANGNWPDSLVTELAARRCIVFFGSGVSAGCVSALDASKRMPTWRALLDHLQSSAALSMAEKSFVLKSIEESKYLDAAEVLREKIDNGDYLNLLRDIFEGPDFQPSEIHKIIHEIEPKITITTNYDKVYDKLCSGPGFNVCKYYEEHLVDDLRSSIRLFIKAHGCVSSVNQTILSRSEYFNMKKKYGGFFDVLNALFVANTILFLGYSLSDPDVQLVLENSNISAKSSRPHYMLLASSNEDESGVMARMMQRVYNVKVIYYDVLVAGDHSESIRMLNQLKDSVTDLRARVRDF